MIFIESTGRTKWCSCILKRLCFNWVLSGPSSRHHALIYSHVTKPSFLSSAVNRGGFLEVSWVTGGINSGYSEVCSLWFPFVKTVSEWNYSFPGMQTAGSSFVNLMLPEFWKCSGVGHVWSIDGKVYILTLSGLHVHRTHKPWPWSMTLILVLGLELSRCTPRAYCQRQELA